MSDAIQFDRVTKVYQGRQIALADVSFTVPYGATVGLLGANGSGKSTLLRLAMGLISASAGDIAVFGRPMRPGAKQLRQRIGFLPDDPAFPGDVTAIHYLDFVSACFGLPRREAKARLGTLIRSVGLTDDAGRRVGTYSTGMRTRLGIAASLMNDPELLVWDEPTAGLDPISRGQTLELLEQLRGRKTIILSSHILGDIDRVCDRLLILNQGQMLFDGSRPTSRRASPSVSLNCVWPATRIVFAPRSRHGCSGPTSRRNAAASASNWPRARRRASWSSASCPSRASAGPPWTASTRPGGSWRTPI